MAPMQINGDFVNNLLSSVERFIWDNVGQPYNTAVSGTSYDGNITIKMKPQDEGVIASVPTIVVPNLPGDYQDTESTGVGDHEVWNYTEFDLEVYPALSADPSGAQKPSIQSAALLRSLFMLLRTGLTMTIYDYSTEPDNPTAIGGAYIKARIIPMQGSIKTALAIHRNRFDVHLQIRYTTASLN